jgi:hypothetical protein
MLRNLPPETVSLDRVANADVDPAMPEVWVRETRLLAAPTVILPNVQSWISFVSAARGRVVLPGVEMFQVSFLNMAVEVWVLGLVHFRLVHHFPRFAVRPPLRSFAT